MSHLMSFAGNAALGFLQNTVTNHLPCCITNCILVHVHEHLNNFFCLT